jgi:hypothetical protein
MKQTITFLALTILILTSCNYNKKTETTHCKMEASHHLIPLSNFK